MQGSDVFALEKSSLLEKGLSALKSTLSALDEEPSLDQKNLDSSLFFVTEDAIQVKWQKGVSDSTFIGFEGRYDYGKNDGFSDLAMVPNLNERDRVVFNFKMAAGLKLTEKGHFYFFTGASNAGLHISDNSYRRDADFYLGVGFEYDLSDDIKLRAEYNLTNYGNNWFRKGFTEINADQPTDGTFLTRMKMPF